ncbi:MAG: hypothetical protein HYY65_00620 [Candidatus Tectomicrobia bacterium]|uniref:Uncharacterized protein n=1 Tax=Tectimicrobiota bacterium TaxID=2528274 RepID=A0A932GMI3_UNCTE|nr:hypothetical protein [Candidatus Tectomicrobia bacterium]
MKNYDEVMRAVGRTLNRLQISARVCVGWSATPQGYAVSLKQGYREASKVIPVQEIDAYFQEGAGSGRLEGLVRSLHSQVASSPHYLRETIYKDPAGRRYL